MEIIRMRFWVLIIFCCCNFFALAQKQEEFNWHEPTKKDLNYYNKREKLTYPSYGFQKIKNLTKAPLDKIPKDYLVSDWDISISDKDFQELSTAEKFTYCLIHPEMYSQNCAEPIYFKNPQTKIFTGFMSYYPSQYWSDRQMKFFKDKRKECLGLFEQTLKEKKHFGMNLKGFLIEINAWEEIPELIAYYKLHPTDNDVLTILLRIMEQSSYQGLRKTPFYTKLFENEDFFTRWIPANKSNVNKILSLAEQFYQTKKK